MKITRIRVYRKALRYATEPTGKPAPETRDGKLHASDAPGMGVAPDFDSLGEPVADYGDDN